MIAFLKRKSKREIILIISLLFPLLSLSQVNENITRRAVLIAHADFTDFSMPDSNELSEILNQYKIRILRSSETLNNCYFFEITPLFCNNCENCKLLIVYWKDERRFFRLNGFRYNEFSLFFNLILLEKYSYSQKRVIKNTNKNRKLIFKDFFLESYQLEELYHSYYDKSGKLTLDSTSCFLRSIIAEY